MKVEIELPEIKGFEYTGEYREPKLKEFYQGGNGLYECSRVGLGSYPILKTKAPKYKTVTNGSFLRESGHIDLNEKFVEIKAIEDALFIIEDLASTEDDRAVMRNLQELLK